MLTKYQENPQQNWHSKDAAMYLITSLVSRGATQRHGVTQTSHLVSIPQFCQQHVLPELERQNGEIIAYLFNIYYLKLLF